MTRSCRTLRCSADIKCLDAGSPGWAVSVLFYSGDRDEPRHMHVEREANRGKFWLDPVRLAESGGFGRAEIRRLEALVSQNVTELRGAWDEYFTD